MENRTISIKANDFGPLTCIDIEIKPLTIFIGPNNSGKSYTAMLAYSILKANQTLLAYVMQPYFRHFDFDMKEDVFYPYRQLRFGDLEDDSIEVGISGKFENKNILEWLDKILNELDKEKKVKFIFSEIPENVKKSFYEILIRDFSSRFERIISTTYASTMNELKRIGSEKESINFEFNTPELSYLLKFYKGNLLLDKFSSEEIEKIVVSIEKKKQDQAYKVYTQKNKIFIKFNLEKKIDKKIIIGSILVSCQPSRVG